MTMMRANLFMLAAITCALPTSPSAAVTVEVAKKCDALVAKSFPPRVPGNPAAGSAKGVGADQAALFKRCIANGGKIDEEGSSGPSKR